MVFEGEYLNGERSGKGKEYYKDGKLRFDGEYLNNKELIGTRYDNNGNIIFKLENNINGKGKEYSYFGLLIFEGEYLNGKKNGKGKEYFNDENFNIVIFEGEYRNDLKWNGIGYDPLNNKVYELIDGKGPIKEYDDYDKLKFGGEYLNGKRNGKGKEYDYGKLIFEGKYLNGEKTGKGIKYI